MKLLTLIGTRPEIIKMSYVIREADKHFEHILVHTGQNYDYELNEVFFEDLKIRKPDFFLNAAGESPAKTIANVIEKLDSLLEQVKPDAFLLYGDTNSCLGIIAAKRRQIPIFHLEAGNRCFDQRVPEEINRKIVDHLSDINMVHSEHARRYLIDEGLPPERIIKTGSPMHEIFDSLSDEIENSKVLNELNLKEKEYFLVSSHREENLDYDENLRNLLNSLEKIHEVYKLPIIFSTHPRTKKKLDSLNISNIKGVQFIKALGFIDYIKLQKNAKCTLSDSGTITEESSILNFPAVMIRNNHERPEGMDVGAVVMSGLFYEDVIRSIEIATSLAETREIDSYQNSYFSQQVVKLISSHVDYINRYVWRKKI